MSKIGKTIIVFLISLAVWFGVAHITDGFGLDAPEGPIVLFLVPIFISIFYYNSAEETKNNVKKGPKTLSEKYDVLVSYKGLAYLMMIASTGFFIYAIVQFGDAPKAARKMLENAMITSTVSYVITMFSLFCLTKIIDFLFDLDKQDKILAPDKIYSEEE